MKERHILIENDTVRANPKLYRWHFKAELVNTKTGEKTVRESYNAVTDNGRFGIADNLLASPSLGKPTHMAIGTGSPAANALGDELDRNALQSKTRNDAVVTMVGFWDAGDGTGALTEAGVFNQSSGGNMWLSNSFSVINKGADDALTITWELEIV